MRSLNPTSAFTSGAGDVQVQQGRQHAADFLGPHPRRVFDARLVVRHRPVRQRRSAPGRRDRSPRSRATRRPSRCRRPARCCARCPAGSAALIFAASSSIGSIEPTSSISWNSLVHRVAYGKTSRKLRTSERESSMFCVGSGSHWATRPCVVQATGGQLVEVPGIQVDHAGSGGRWRFQGDQVVALRVAQQFLATVAQAHVDARIGCGIEVALEQRRGLDHRRQQLGDHPVLQARIAGQGAGGDAGAETDHQRRARFAVVDQQRQQRLNAACSAAMAWRRRYWTRPGCTSAGTLAGPCPG